MVLYSVVGEIYCILYILVKRFFDKDMMGATPTIEREIGN